MYSRKSRLCRTYCLAMQNYSVCHCFLRVSSHALHLLPVISGANLHDKSAQNCADCVADFPAEAKKKKKRNGFTIRNRGFCCKIHNSTLLVDFSFSIGKLCTIHKFPQHIDKKNSLKSHPLAWSCILSWILPVQICR